MDLRSSGNLLKYFRCKQTDLPVAGFNKVSMTSQRPIFQGDGRVNEELGKCPQQRWLLLSRICLRCLNRANVTVKVPSQKRRNPAAAP